MDNLPYSLIALIPVFLLTQLICFFKRFVITFAIDDVNRGITPHVTDRVLVSNELSKILHDGVVQAGPLAKGVTGSDHSDFQ